MARIPKRLFGPAQLTNAAATKYTVPAGTKTIVRHIHVQNPSGSPLLFFLSIGAEAAGTRLFDSYGIPASSVIDHYCYYVLEATEIIQSHDNGNLLVMTIDGDELVLG